MEQNTVSRTDAPKNIRALIIDDSENDVLLVIRELKKGGYHPLYERIETAQEMRKALSEKQWDIILCDYKMPKFNAPAAIEIFKKTNINIPMIIISGTIGEETAIECMRLGAQDYIMKNNLSRLCPAIAREIEEFKNRRKQKLAEELLCQSEEKYRTVLENMQEGYFECDLAGSITFINDSVCRFLGYPRNELMGLNNRQYMDEKNAKEVFRAYNNVYKTGKPIKELSWQIIRKDGVKRYLAGSVSLINDASGKPAGFRGIARDVTERREMEEKLKDEEYRFRALAEQSSDIILLVNKEGVITYTNRIIDILGIPAEKRTGRNAFSRVHPDDQQTVIDSFNILFSNINAPVQKAEVRLHHSDGRWIPFEIVGSNLVHNNVIEAAIINLRDITDRKRFEEELRKREMMFRSLFENNPLGVFLLKNRVFVEVNSTLCEITGYKPEELNGQSVRIGYESDEEFERAGKILYEQVTKKGTGFTEAKLRRKNGEIFDGLLYLSPIDPQDISLGFECIMIDITERKRSENALKDSELKYRNIFENAMEGIYQATNDGKLITANSAFAKMAGYDSPEDLMKSIKDIGKQLYVHPQDRQRFLEIRAAKGFVDNFEVEFYKKDGTTFWVVINARAVKDKQGNVIYTEGLIEDITLRKQAEEKHQQTLERLKQAVNTTIQVLVSALEARDPYTVGHQSRAADLACAIAGDMELPVETSDGIRMAGIIHDIGKLSIPVEILSKPTKLTALEFSLIKEHSRSGYEMLKDVETTWPLAEIVYQHHERMDGSGYPRKLKGDEILIEARILAVADVVEAMASHRPYRASLGIEVALDEIEKNKGRLYDEKAVNSCLKLFREKGYEFS